MDSKVSQLPTLATPAGEDLIYVIDSPNGTPASTKLSLADLFSKVIWPTAIANATNFVHTGHFTSGNNSVIFSAPVTANALTVTANNGIRLATFTTPPQSNVTIQQGHFFFDANFIYVATANNVLKRVALSAF